MKILYEIRRQTRPLMKPARGGKRTGAGRKRRESPRVAITIRLEPRDAAEFKEICADNHKSQAEQVAKWVKQKKHQHE